MTDTHAEDRSPNAASPTDVVSYRAQTAEGRAIAGTIVVADGEEAIRALEQAGFRAIELQPTEPGRRRGKALDGADFQAFNQQLAHLADAGLPLERGLRLIAREMPSKKMRRTVDAVADELECGRPLEQAIEQQRGAFPPLYGSLLKMGARTGRLSPLLLGLGRHLVLRERLRSAVWRAASYPLVVLFALGLVLVFLSVHVVPHFDAIFEDFQTEVPEFTSMLLTAADYVPWVVLPLMGMLVAVLLAGTLTSVSRRWFGGLADGLPILGRVLRASRVARWCDALRVALDAGLPLPEALRTAGEALGDGRFIRDSQAMAELHESGRKLDELHPRKAVPPTVTAGIDFAVSRGDPDATLSGQAEMYREQAETWLGVVQTALTPILLVGVAGVLGVVLVALCLPMIMLMQSI